MDDDNSHDDKETNPNRDHKSNQTLSERAYFLRCRRIGWRKDIVTDDFQGAGNFRREGNIWCVCSGVGRGNPGGCGGSHGGGIGHERKW